MPAPREGGARRVAFTNAPPVEFVPWIDEPMHTALLTNAHARVYEAALAPGAVTLFHSHAANTAYVVVRPADGATVINEIVKDGAAGPDPPATLTVRSADCFCFPCADAGAPWVHRLRVPIDAAGGGPHFIGVEVLEPGGGGGATAAPGDFPAQFVAAGVAERSFFMVRLTLAPGGSVGPFSGPSTPCVVVVVRSGALDATGPFAALAGQPPGAVAFWPGSGDSWSATNTGGAGEFEAALVVWTGEGRGV